MAKMTDPSQSKGCVLFAVRSVLYVWYVWCMCGMRGQVKA